ILGECGYCRIAHGYLVSTCYTQPHRCFFTPTACSAGMTPLGESIMPSCRARNCPERARHGRFRSLRRAVCVCWLLALLCFALLAGPAGAQIGKLVPEAVPQPEARPTIFQGQLSKTDALDRVQKHSHCKVYEIELQAGKAYSIDLKSDGFDSFL